MTWIVDLAKSIGFFVIYNVIVFIFAVSCGASSAKGDEDNYLRVIFIQELIAFLVIGLLVTNIGG